MRVLAIPALSILTAVLYRMGGSDKYPKSVRRFGCPIPVLLSLYIAGIQSPWWAYLISYFALYGTLTTYHDYLTKNGSENWLCWLVTGIFYGLAFLPFLVVWPMVLIRAGVLGVLTMIWSEVNDNPVWEECGRGFLLCITVLFFII